MCTYCKDTGWIVAKDRNDSSLFSFGCNSCSKSDRYPKITKWNSKLSYKYETDFQVVIPDNKKKILAEKDDEEEIPW